MWGTRTSVASHFSARWGLHTTCLPPWWSSQAASPLHGPPCWQHDETRYASPTKRGSPRHEPWPAHGTRGTDRCHSPFAQRVGPCAAMRHSPYPQVSATNAQPGAQLLWSEARVSSCGAGLLRPAGVPQQLPAQPRLCSVHTRPAAGLQPGFPQQQPLTHSAALGKLPVSFQPLSSGGDTAGTSGECGLGAGGFTSSLLLNSLPTPERQRMA